MQAKTLGTGAAFGELALITDQPRSATVVCKTQCSFAVLEKEDYQQILGTFDKEVMWIRVK